MAGRGAWRQDGEARRVESNGAIVASPGSARMPSHMMPCNPAMSRRFLATVPVGAALETTVSFNLRASTRPMARRPLGERKDALDTAVV